jgi:hypothetical protein
MDVILELSPEVSQRYQMRDQSDPMITQLTMTIDSLNISIKPQYRGDEDASSNYFFIIETKDWDECQRIATMFDQLPAVKAAYCKPEAEPAVHP